MWGLEKGYRWTYLKGRTREVENRHTDSEGKRSGRWIERVALTYIRSVQFSLSVVSDSLWPHRLQHARPPCPLPTPGVFSNSCPLSQWCHPTISSSVVPFSSCLHLSQHQGLFKWVSTPNQVAKSIGVSASTSVLPMNTQDWSPLGWTGWISLQSMDSQESSPALQFKRINSLVLSFVYSPTLTSLHDYWKNDSLDLYWLSN